MEYNDSNGLKEKNTKISTGFRGLDCFLNGGFQNGCLYVIGGKARNGKKLIST